MTKREKFTIVLILMFVNVALFFWAATGINDRTLGEVFIALFGMVTIGNFINTIKYIKDKD